MTRSLSNRVFAKRHFSKATFRRRCSDKANFVEVIYVSDVLCDCSSVDLNLSCDLSEIRS